MAATLADIPIRCTDAEAARFNPPPGQTCAQYAGAFANAASGYLLNPDATADCGYCPYRTGTDYMATLNVKPSDKWPYMAIFLAFCISNWALVYFFIYTVRIRGWSLGLGRSFGVLGMAADAVKRVVTKVVAGGRKKKEVEA